MKLSGRKNTLIKLRFMVFRSNTGKWESRKKTVFTICQEPQNLGP